MQAMVQKKISVNVESVKNAIAAKNAPDSIRVLDCPIKNLCF